MLLGQAVELGLRGIKGGLIFRRKLDRMRISPAQTMGVRKVEMGFRPFPTLGLPEGVCLPPEFRRDQQIEQRHVLEIAAAILGEEVAQDRAARLRIGFRTDKDRAAIRGGDMGFGQQAADRAGITVIGQPLDRRLPAGHDPP